MSQTLRLLERKILFLNLLMRMRLLFTDMLRIIHIWLHLRFYIWHPIKIDLMLDAKTWPIKWNVRCSLISSILLADSGCNKTGLHKYFHLYHFVWQCNTIYHVNKVTSNILIYCISVYISPCISRSEKDPICFAKPPCHPPSDSWSRRRKFLENIKPHFMTCMTCRTQLIMRCYLIVSSPGLFPNAMTRSNLEILNVCQSKSMEIYDCQYGKCLMYDINLCYMYDTI